MRAGCAHLARSSPQPQSPQSPSGAEPVGALRVLARSSQLLGLAGAPALAGPPGAEDGVVHSETSVPMAGPGHPALETLFRCRPGEALQHPHR